MTDWKDHAREMIAAGSTVKAAALAVGRSVTSLRYALDINGARQQQNAWKTRERAAIKSTRPKRVAAAADRAGVSSYLEKPAPARATITLPTFSMPALPVEFDAKPQIRLAPSPRVTVNEGAERIRAIHQRMLRDGKIAERGLVEEFGL